MCLVFSKTTIFYLNCSHMYYTINSRLSDLDLAPSTDKFVAFPRVRYINSGHPMRDRHPMPLFTLHYKNFTYFFSGDIKVF